MFTNLVKAFTVVVILGLCSIAGAVTYRHMRTAATPTRVVGDWSPAVGKEISAAPGEDAPPDEAKPPTGQELDLSRLKDTNVYVYRGAPVAEGFAIYIVMWKGNFLFMQVVQEDTVLMEQPKDDDAEPQ